MSWQILEMYHNLNEITKQCGGLPLPAKKLSEMSALELMELLAPNDVRFCVKRQKEIPMHLGEEWGRGTLSIDVQPETSSFRVYFSAKGDFINITFREMEDIISFVKGKL